MKASFLQSKADAGKFEGCFGLLSIAKWLSAFRLALKFPVIEKNSTKKNVGSDSFCCSRLPRCTYSARCPSHWSPRRCGPLSLGLVNHLCSSRHYWACQRCMYSAWRFSPRRDQEDTPASIAEETLWSYCNATRNARLDKSTAVSFGIWGQVGQGMPRIFFAFIVKLQSFLKK